MRENIVDGPAGRFVEFFLGHMPIAVAGPLGPGEIPVEPTSMLQQFPEQESLMEQVQLRLSVWRYIERQKQRNPPPPAQREALATWANSLPGQSLEGGTVDYVLSAVLTTSGKWHTLTVVVVLV